MARLVAPPGDRPARKHWALDPLFSTNVKMLAAMMHALPEATTAGDVLWLVNHPVRHVDVLGTVISLDPRRPMPAIDRRVSVTLDDGSGLIECVLFWHDDRPPPSLSQYHIGAVLRVHGRLGKFRGRRQVLIDRCWREDDPLAEVFHWLRARELWMNVYSASFFLPSHVTAAAQEPCMCGTTTAHFGTTTPGGSTSADNMPAAKMPSRCAAAVDERTTTDSGSAAAAAQSSKRPRHEASASTELAETTLLEELLTSGHSVSCACAPAADGPAPTGATSPQAQQHEGCASIPVPEATRQLLERHVLHVLRDATDGLRAREVAVRLPTAASASAIGAVPHASAGEQGRALRAVVEGILRALEESSRVYRASEHFREGVYRVVP